MFFFCGVGAWSLRLVAGFVIVPDTDGAGDRRLLVLDAFCSSSSLGCQRHPNLSDCVFFFALATCQAARPLYHRA